MLQKAQQIQKNIGYVLKPGGSMEVEGLNKIDFDWLIEEAKSAARYKKALEEITKTSGTSMVHNCSIQGHKKAVEIAEEVLEEE